MALDVCRSTSPHASDVGRAWNDPICSLSPANHALRTTSATFFTPIQTWPNGARQVEVKHGGWCNGNAPPFPALKVGSIHWAHGLPG